jgi:hypothetical protein
VSLFIDNCAVSFAVSFDLPSSRHFQPDKHLYTTRERTRPPDTPAPRLSLIYFWVHRGACLAMMVHAWPEACRLPCGLCPERTNKPSSLNAPSVPPSLVRYFCLEHSSRRRKDLEEVTSHRGEFSLASPILPSHRVPFALLSVLAF